MKYTDDDYCDIYENKICDNCGKCLEMEGVDIRAIKIEDIAKDVKENQVLIEEYEKELESLKELKENEDIANEELLNKEYEKLIKQGVIKSVQDEEYEDAFDHIDYNESFLSEEELEETTVEVFPGVRVLRKRSDDKK